MRLMRHHPRLAQLLPLALLLGAADAARAQEQASPRAILEKHGMLGAWAYDCYTIRICDRNSSGSGSATLT
jgi:hypothetical protein